MDWTPLAATLAGGLIGSLAETSGRRNARKQSALERSRHLEDQRLQHELDLREARQRELRKSSREAVFNITSALHENAIPLLDPQGAEISNDEVVKRTVAVILALSKNMLLITDEDLRAKISKCAQILDLATIPTLQLDLTTREIATIVRKNLYLWLGSWLREEPLASPTDDWHLITDRLEEWTSQWQAQISARGFSIQPFESK